MRGHGRGGAPPTPTVTGIAPDGQDKRAVDDTATLARSNFVY